MIKVLIADDHAIVREGLKQILADTSDIIAADEATNSYEIMNKVRENRYDLVLLDISLPGRSGLDVLKQMKSEKPALPVLVLSMHSEKQYGIRVIRAGAAGYLTKDSASEELIGAIRLVSAGRKYISSTLAERLAVNLGGDTEKLPHETLSDREFEVLRAIASGKTVSNIAQDLLLSVKTVSTYRSRILEKMDMRTNAELTYYGIQNGLVE